MKIQIINNKIRIVIILVVILLISLSGYSQDMAPEEKVSTENAEHYIWGAKCDGWHLLKSDSLSVIQEKMPPGTTERLHYHLKAQQVFYILHGIANFEIDGKTISLASNQSIHVPRGIKHRIYNSSSSDIEFLVISTPKAQGDRINLD